MNLKYFRAGDVLAAFEMLEIADTLFTELPNEDPEEEGPGGKTTRISNTTITNYNFRTLFQK